jgi:hypothetical protein
MDELEKGVKDTQIRRDTQVRGSLGVPPSGGEPPKPEQVSEGGSSTRESEFGEDERISER